MCFDDDPDPPIPLSAGAAPRGEDITLQAADGARVLAYRALPEGTATAQVVVLPDVRGLHNFYRELALRFADVGMRALVIDYFGRTAPDDRRDESFDFMQHVVQMTPQHFEHDLRAAVTALRSAEDGDLPAFTVGFCMGGSLSFFAGTLEVDLAGVVGFYGRLTNTRGAVTPAVDFATRVRCPVLGLFGGADEGIPPADIERFDRELTAASVPHELVVYPGAPHSFFDRKAAEYATASADAWSRVQGFIADHGVVKV